MTQQYNIGDFYPHSGQEIKSDGTIVNTADGVDANGNQGVLVNGRGTSYQRIMVSQPISASGNISTVLNLSGLGTKAINVYFKTTGIAQLVLYGSDANGNANGNNSLVSSLGSGAITGSVLISDYGGAPYINIYVYDKSASANTCQYVDVWWTKS